MNKKIVKIEGEKIYLALSKKEDLPAFVKWINDPEVIQFTHARPYDLRQEGEWFDRVQANPDEPLFSVFTKDDDWLIGNCGIHIKMPREDQFDGKTFVGILIGEKEEWNKGYGTDVLKTLLKYTKNELQEEEVYLTVYTENAPAIRSYEKCGFEPVLQRSKMNRFGISKEELVMVVEL